MIVRPNGKTLFAVVVYSCALLLSGCLEGSGTDDVSISTGGGNCGNNYSEMITASERQAANNCGTQVSTQFLAADSYYQAALEACRRGETQGANQYYSQYQQQVSVARSVSSGLGCGGSSGSGGGSGSGGITVIPGPPSYYNLCIAQSSTHIYASCWGPVRSSDSSCPSNSHNYSYLRNYSSSSACIQARDNWLNSQ